MSKRKIPKWLSALLAILVAVLGSLPFLLWGETIRKISAAGYIGLGVACFLTNATVFLPASGIAFTVSASTVLNPFLCATVGGCGTALGELVSYFCGKTGKKLIADVEVFSKIEYFVRNYGFFTVLLFAFLPVPLFDLVGVTAGVSRMPVSKYLAACILGKGLKMFVYVLLAGRFLT